MLKNRRRSLSASRTIDHTIHLMGKIGATLRSSAKKNPKEMNFTIANSGHLKIVEDNEVEYPPFQQRISRADAHRTARCDVWATKSVNRTDGHLTNAYLQLDSGENGNLYGKLSAAKLKSARRRSIASERYNLENRNNHHSPSVPHYRPKFVLENEEEDEEEDSDADEVDPNSAVALITTIPSQNDAYGRGRRSLMSSGLSSPLSDMHQQQQVIETGYSQSCPTTPAMARRFYLKEGQVQLTSLSTLQTHERYFFLFNEVLLVSKRKGENSYKLKEKIALDHVWVSSNNCTNSFLIGWPVKNYVAHFKSEDEKNKWFEKISSCVKRRLSPKSTTVTVVLAAIEGRQQFIRREIRNGVQASAIIEELKQDLNLPAIDPNLATYELCFESGPAFSAQRSRSHSNSILFSAAASGGRLTAGGSSLTAFPGGSHIQALRGVENVYAILMDYVNIQLGLNLSESQLAHLDTCPMVNCRLMLRQTSVASRMNNLRTHSALNIVHQIKKVLGRTDATTTTSSSSAATTNKGKLFGCRLQGSMPPQTISTLVDHLLLYGSDVEGIFRKSPKHETFRILRTQLDQGLVPDFHQFPIHVAASLLKDYIRQIPGQLLISGNYQLWMEVVESSGAPDEQRRLCRQLLRLLPPAHTVLLKNLLRLMRKIAANESMTLMNASSLSICLAPCLLENGDLMDSARRVPELIVYLMENAHDLFDGFSEEGPLLESSESSCNGSRPPTDIDEDEQQHRNKGGLLHQSTDSGLSDDALMAAQNKRIRTKKSTAATLMTMSLVCESTSGLKTAPVHEKSRRQCRRSISPDSALFDQPLSDYSSCEYPNGSRRTSSSTNSSVEDGVISNQKTIGTKRFIGHRSHPIDASSFEKMEFYEEREEEKTPVMLSREPSDVNTHFSGKRERHSMVHDDQDTLRAPAQSRMDPSKSSSCEYAVIRRPRVNNQRTASRNRIESVKLNGDENPLSTSSAIRKTSAPSNSFPCVVPRRSLLPSKIETLGLQDDVGGETASPLGFRAPQKHNAVKYFSPAKEQPVIMNAKTVVSSQQQSSSPTTELSDVNVRATASRFHVLSNKQQQQQQQQQNKQPISSRIEKPGSTANKCPKLSLQGSIEKCSELLHQQQTSSNPTIHKNPEPSSTPRASITNNPTPIVNQRPSLSRRKPPSLDISGALPSTFYRRAPMEPSQSLSGTPKYRPPKRTAEEILLDKLEVNWSVPDIRKTFQQSSQIKPIDTVYAKLPAAATALTAATENNNKSNSYSAR